MKHIVYIFLMFFSYESFSQVVIPLEGQVDLKAELRVYSTDKGVLIPRLTNAKMNAITLPATGLWVYNTTLHLFYFYDSSTWNPVSQTKTGTADPANKYKGEYYFNTTDNKLHYWNGTSWVIVNTL